jgi:hypothetical protein
MRKLFAALALAGGITLATSPLAFADVDVDVDASNALQNAEIATNLLTGADVLNDLGGVLNGLDLDLF